ncbi:hypothetical protein MARPO_0085s0050 [Marchantia polymorpha]|uniref:Uncharacterized protein n=1 Tax=Marchantia polymorpha TaxID=3197 RepID=A0A2R6WIZ8_MARPO|nr:hypothetical protein MARPO_0085s0050 [Marchantia polymorpha]|eukprot:PTQ33837.1 hypothetical protein MARPO_0085s0050 [Marchantia polymorpha]
MLHQRIVAFCQSSKRLARYPPSPSSRPHPSSCSSPRSKCTGRFTTDRRCRRLDDEPVHMVGSCAGLSHCCGTSVSRNGRVGTRRNQAYGSIDRAGNRPLEFIYY